MKLEDHHRLSHELFAGRYRQPQHQAQRKRVFLASPCALLGRLHALAFMMGDSEAWVQVLHSCRSASKDELACCTICRKPLHAGWTFSCQSSVMIPSRLVCTADPVRFCEGKLPSTNPQAVSCFLTYCSAPAESQKSLALSSALADLDMGLHKRLTHPAPSPAAVTPPYSPRTPSRRRTACTARSVGMPWSCKHIDPPQHTSMICPWL